MASGYYSTSDIQLLCSLINYFYSDFVQLITLSDSHEGRKVYALRIGKGNSTSRPGVLFIGGVHARELVNPDLLIKFAIKLCAAYSQSNDLVFGAKSYSASSVELIVETLDLFILPLVNPDGRSYVLDPAGDAWWRKNRNPNPGLSCQGVDINRNFDFLWSSGIGTSASSCSEIYKGGGAFSEPETTNIKKLLDDYPQIERMIDVHSYSQLILYPWGDDDLQTTSPSMNFTNSTYDGLRGTTGDMVYREYMSQADLDRYVATANRIRDGIASHRGRTYTVQPSINLYPTTGTSNDYSYSRHIANSAKQKVIAYCVETGTQFQPVYSEAEEIMTEVSIGLTEFLFDTICPVEATTTLSRRNYKVGLEAARQFRDRGMAATQAGQRYLSLFRQHRAEVVQLLFTDKALARELAALLPSLFSLVRATGEGGNKKVSAKVIDGAEKLLTRLDRNASKPLSSDLRALRKDLPRFKDVTLQQGFERLSRG